MAIGGPSFPSQQAGNPSSGTEKGAARVQPNPQQVVLPIANVSRIMRSVLPRHVKIGEDTKEFMAKLAGKFISHITQEANRQCKLEHRKIVTGDDLIAAMRRLGFERHAEAVTIYLARLREHNNIANGVRAVVPRQDPRNHVPVPRGGGNNHEQVDVPMAPTTPPHAAAYRAPMVSGLSGDEGSDGSESESDGETSKQGKLWSC